jgi:hypothetical protein
VREILENKRGAWMEDELASFKTPAVRAFGLAEWLN